MVADDLVYVRGSGKVAGKREFIADYSASDFKLEPFILDEVDGSRSEPQGGMRQGIGHDWDRCAFNYHPSLKWQYTIKPSLLATLS